MRNFMTWILALAAPLLIIAAAATLRSDPQTARAEPPKKKKPGNLEYWLNRATTAPDSQPDDKTEKTSDNNVLPRTDAVPGAVEMSDGKQLAGWLYTTRDKPWVVFDPATDRWRRIPFIAVLSINAIVTEEKYELQWRWKEMGAPEKIYTGRKFPYRRFLWEFRLIDGTTIKGAVKGQPLWVAWDGKTAGPMVLHERDKGKIDVKLEDLHYVKKIVVSTKMRDAVLADRKKQPATRPAK